MRIELQSSPYGVGKIIEAKKKFLKLHKRLFEECTLKGHMIAYEPFPKESNEPAGVLVFCTNCTSDLSISEITKARVNSIKIIDKRTGA